MMRWLWALFVNVWVLLFWPWFAWRRARAAPRSGWLDLEVDGAIQEFPVTRRFWEPSGKRLDLYRVRRTLERAGADARVSGVIVTLKSLKGGLATATALRDLLVSVAATGKRTAVFLPYGCGTHDYYVATAADLVLVDPEAQVAPLGFSVEAPYFKHALAKLELTPEVYAKGKFKTAGETWVKEAMSAAQREQLAAILDQRYAALLQAAARSRRADPDTVASWIAGGPFRAARAMDEGLIDGVAHDDDVGRRLVPRSKAPKSKAPTSGAPKSKALKSKEGPPRLELGRYASRTRIPWVRFHRSPRIGVIDVTGAIVSQAPGLLPAVDEESFAERVERAADDRRVHAVIVSIDSRGGSALASSRMLRRLELLARDKPVVAQLRDVAASGGYMIAVGAKEIVAQPTTVTGSIGVVAARLVVRSLLSRLGVSMQVVKRGERADLFSPWRVWSEQERESFERELSLVYRSFVEAVGRGRGRSPDAIEPLAEGRIWSGADAQRHGLVDHLGGFDVAVHRAASLCGLDPGRVEIVTLRSSGVASSARRLSRGADAFGGANVAHWMEALRGLGVTSLMAEHLALALSRPDGVWAWCELPNEV